MTRYRNVRVRGLPALRRQLWALAASIERSDQEAAEAAGRELAEAWRADVPVLDGHYRDSIGVARDRDASRSQASAIVTPLWVPGLPDGEQPMAYAARLEFGDEERSADPSAGPAFDGSIDGQVDAAADVLGDAVDRVLV